jgi:hypothetical protein
MEGVVTKLELQKSHDAMARFLVALCRFSDVVHNGYRSAKTEEHYLKARRLLKRAGAKYQPPKQGLNDDFS